MAKLYLHDARIPFYIQYYLIKLSIKILVLVLKDPGSCKIGIVIASEIQRLKITQKKLALNNIQL